MPTDDHTDQPETAPPSQAAGEAAASRAQAAVPQPDVADPAIGASPPEFEIDMQPAQRPDRRAGSRRLPRRRTVLLATAALVIAASWVAAVIGGRHVAQRFEAREHETPTRLYGRAVALAPGALLSRDDLVARLQRLGYRPTRGEPRSPGEYHAARALTVFLRRFETAAGPAEPRTLRIRWDGRRIDEVEDLQTRQSVEDALLPPEAIATLYGSVHEDRTVLPMSEFPTTLVDAVLVTEDRRFYRHHGLDPVGIARAAVANASSGAIEQGGSTLTQQLAKNLYFDQRRTVPRKLAEAVTAFLLETRYDKQRILAAYLNEVYLGQRGSVSIKGFARAASFYFGKDIRMLDLAESATLAGLIRAPGVYNPFVHPERALERRNQVLAAMEQAGKITAQQHRDAQQKPLALASQTSGAPDPRGIAYLGDYVRQMIARNAPDGVGGDLTVAGYRVFTTIDPALQRAAEEAVTQGIERLERDHRKLRRSGADRRLQGALVALDPHDGSVLAMVGGRDYTQSQFNRAMQAHRPAGSLFKPFVYLAGYETARPRDRDGEPFTPATVLQDEPLEMRVARKRWAPANYDGLFRGPVTAQLALEQSLNIPTVRAAMQIGLKSVVATAQAAGIQSPLKPYPSLALGAQEVTPLEIAAAYATIANGGVRNDASMVQAIVDRRGERVAPQRVEPERAFSAASTYLVTVGLEGALHRGTGAAARSLGLRGTAAGKTGTTDDYRDAWFCGFTPDLLALVWIGFDDGSSTHLTGAAAALPVWVDFMRRAGAQTDAEFPQPRGITWEEVDPTTGGRARGGCPDARMMAFLAGTEPLEKCGEHSWFAKWW